MQSIHLRQEMIDHCATIKRGAQTIALVPTMGALHEGHLSLVEHAKKLADHVVVSIFVNPTQFGVGEDLDRYPRTLEADLTKLHLAKADVAFVPDISEIYGDNAQAKSFDDPITKMLEGAFRPGHFDGVTTVVNKLFTITQPNFALFGEKDYQQLCVIRHFTEANNLPISIVGCPTMREKDGLAKSSRNRYLDAQEREISKALYTTMLACAQAYEKGQAPTDIELMGKKMLLHAGFDSIDYFAICDAKTLEKPPSSFENARLLVAAHIGKTRLIDNISLISSRINAY